MKRFLSAWLRFGVPFVGVLAALLGATAGAAKSPPGGDDWKYDVVYRKKGEPYQGLVLERTADSLLMKGIVRRPGRPTIVYRISLPNDDIDHVDLLPEAEREELRRRVKKVEEEGKRLAEQMKALDPTAKEPIAGADRLALHPTPWPGDPKTKALAYSSSHFRLISNAPRRVVEVTAIRLEQAYAAYVRALPPRAKGEATTIFLPQSLADYQTLVHGRGRDLLNPAFFDPARNEVLCAFDWRRLTEERERIHRHHVKLKADLDEREAELRKAYKGAIPPELKAPIDAKRREIQAVEAKNQDIFERAQRRLFQRLYHEAFHAYLHNFLYPPPDGDVPRWLNEGLAQIFETAIFEVGELRIDHADEERVRAVRQALKKDAFLSLSDLLRSGPKQFQVIHGDDKQVSDRYYLASWALAYYLTFDRKLLGTPALDGYIRDLKHGRDPLGAFAKLTGQPLPKFEREFLDYLLRLRPGGVINKAG